MKIGWPGLSDEEYVEQLRRTYQQSVRWLWPMTAGFCLLAFTSLGIHWSLEFSRHRFLLGPPPTPIASLPGNHAYVMGWNQGFQWVSFPLISLSMLGFLFLGLRTWRLLLQYHDALTESGLLPIEERPS